jgi:hypothetical protein
LADGDREERYVQQLKKILRSDIGVISYNEFPEFRDGEDFKNKYGLQQ